MKAQYIGQQERFNGPPLILVNVTYPWGVNTEVYQPEKHDLSNEDLQKLKKNIEDTVLGMVDNFLTREES